MRLSPLLAMALASMSVFSGLRAQESARDATRVIADFDAIRYPGWGSKLSEEEHRRLVESAALRQCELAIELAKLAPEHEQLPRLLERRWSLLMNTFDDVPTVLRETRAAVAARRTDALVRRARVLLAAAALRTPTVAPDERFELVHAAIAANPGDGEWAAALLAPLALETTLQPRRQLELIEFAIERYPDAFETARLRGHKNVLERLGEELELCFESGGTQHDLRQQRGHRVVIAVWSDREHAARDQADLERLAARGVAIVSVYFGPLPDSIDPPRAPWPTFVDARGQQSWAWELGVRWSPVYLSLDESGKLDAAAQAIEPIRRALAP